MSNQNVVRWNIAVSPATDQELRILLAHQGGKKGDLSKFVEQAVRKQIFEKTAQQAQSENKAESEAELSNAIEEALDWARQKQ